MRNRMLVGIVCLGVGIFAQAVVPQETELLSNGSFDEILEQWGTSSAMGSWIPYQYPARTVSLDPPVMSFMGGPIITQPLNVADIANQSVTISVGIGSDWGLGDGNAVGIDLDYLDSAGERRVVTVLNPDNSVIPSGGVAQFQESYVFPADAVRLVGLTLAKKTDQWGAFVDNISLTTMAGLVAGPVPSVNNLSPTAIPYGEVLTISGSDFGGVSGVVRVGGSTNGVTVQTWSDQSITALIDGECIGGAVEVEALGVRSSEQRMLTISSPRFFLNASVDQAIALAGQVIEVDLQIAFRGGFSTTDGIVLSLPDHPGASVFSRNPVVRDGGSLLSFDTSGLSTGVHQVVVLGTATGQSPRETTFEIDIREVESCTLDLDGTTFIEQAPQMAMLQIMDTEGNDISYELPWASWSSSASEVDVFQEPEIWGSLWIFPHATGSATLQATLPNGAVHSFSVSADIPAEPSVDVHRVESWVMSNNPAETNLYYWHGTSPVTGWFSKSYSSDLQFHDSWWGDDNRAYSSYFTAAGATPGTHFIRASVGDLSDGILFEVVNDPATGLINGRVAQFGGDMHHGASGYLEFHNPAGGLLFDRQVWSHSADFTVPSIPPGDYHLRFVSDFGEEDWYPNADSNTAATVTIVAGAETDGVSFTFGDDQAVSDPEMVGNPGETPGGGFGFSVQTEMNRNYQFIKSTTLRDGSWFVLDSLWGDGTVMDLEDTNTATHAYYRVVPE